MLQEHNTTLLRIAGEPGDPWGQEATGEGSRGELICYLNLNRNGRAKLRKPTPPTNEHLVELLLQAFDCGVSIISINYGLLREVPYCGCWYPSQKKGKRKLSA